jgi:disulfide bond formation protein DsbB
VNLPIVNRRLGNAAGALACAAMMGYAIYAERVLGFEPCPLCMFQRVGVSALGVIFLLAAAHNPASVRGARGWGVALLVTAAFPAYVAGRDVFPFTTVLQKVLFGAGECQKIDWAFLGLAMPAWVLIGVLALAAWAAFVNLRRSSQ